MSKSMVVVVTGVSSGIGCVAPKKFAMRKCLVFGTVRSVAEAEQLPGVKLIEMDVRDDTSVKRGIQSIIDQAGRIDVLVNNAGMNRIGAVEETTIGEAASLTANATSSRALSLIVSTAHLNPSRWQARSSKRRWALGVCAALRPDRRPS